MTVFMRCLLAATLVLSTGAVIVQPIVAAASWPSSSQARQDGSQETDTELSKDLVAFSKRVKVGRAEATAIAYMTIIGPYEQHPERLQDMLDLRLQLDLPKNTELWGIYPDDPDLVSPDELTWQLAFSMVQGSPPTLGLSQRHIPSSDLVSVETALPDVAKDGRFLVAWLGINGFVQIGPTRMQFHTDDSSELCVETVTIVIPVKKRSLVSAVR